MKKETIAVIALIIIVAGALSAYLLINYGADIFNTQPKPDENMIEIGDCIDVNYTGRYASNNTIFDSSYKYVENKSGGDPLQIFVTFNTTQSPPTGYSLYSPNIIKGLMTRLIGLKNGTSYTLGPIPPEEAYGKKFILHDTVATKTFNGNYFNINFSLNQTLELIEKTPEYIKMKWVNLPENKFTMSSFFIHQSFNLTVPPESFEDFVTTSYVYSLWENATEIINTTGEKAIVKTTPNKEKNFLDNVQQIPLDLSGEESFFYFPNVTTATYDNDTIFITTVLNQGETYTYTSDSYYGTITNVLTVNSISSGVMNISIFITEYNQTYFYNVNQTVQVNRVYEVPLIYNMSIEFLEQVIPDFMVDLNREGFSLDKLAGESLIFEVTIESVYKTSQEES